MRIGFIKQIIIAILTLFLCTCKPATDKMPVKNSIEINNLDTISLQIENADNSIVHRIPSVEDTVQLEIGGKLYFHYLREAPKDSITVVNSTHYYHDNEVYRTYKFIVHSKKSIFHTSFTPNELDKIYKAYFDEEQDESGWRYSKEFVEYYYKMIEEQRGRAENTSVSEAIRKYAGYWIYLTKYEGKFYIDDKWAWLSSFRITDGIVIRHFMDGTYPFVIEQFQENQNGDFQMKLVSEESVLYKLIDAKLSVYQDKDENIIVPAKNVHKFEIIEYANNTGDLIP